MPEQVPMGERPWMWRVAVGFVIATLVALVLVPWLVQRRVDSLRAEISAAEPARTLISRWQYNLARQLAAIDELLLTGDSAVVATYVSSVRREQEITGRLGPLAAELGPRVASQFGHARALAEHWHTRVREEDVLRLGGRPAAEAEISRELDLFEETLAAVALMDSEISSEIEVNLDQIRSAERKGLTLTFLLGALALMAAATVIAIQARVREFARAAEHGRSQAAAALAERERSEESRRRLLRGITHDVKNPLGAAKGYIELLSIGVKAPLAPGQKPLLEGVERSIDSALEIIDDLLNVSRTEGNIKIQFGAVDLNEIGQHAVDEFTPAAHAAAHAIEFVPAPAPLIVQTDRPRVLRVIENLISNAIKYTPAPGRVVVRAEYMEHGGPGRGPWGTVLVTDTGPGIPPDKREAVFQEYTRLETERTKGHGLGLAIARRIARHLGGDIMIADARPGATFVLWLPVNGQPVENAD